MLFSCQNANKNSKVIEKNLTLLPDSLINAIKVCTEMPVPDTSRDGKPLSGRKWSFWDKYKRTLYVAFIDGDPIVQEKVIAVAKEWENYCNKEFLFINGTQKDIEPDITVSFKEIGSWSEIGKVSKLKVPSMNLGWLKPDTDDEEYRRVVLHEFGHALGLVHEHQNPNYKINWNKENIYAYYFQKFGWQKELTDKNFFQVYNANQMNSSAFDSLSIMLYEIPAVFTTDGFKTKANTQLSETDKKWIGIIYPK